MLFAQKRVLAHLDILYENEWLQYCLSLDLRQKAAFLVLVVRYFQPVSFLIISQGQGPGPDFRRCALTS